MQVMEYELPIKSETFPFLFYEAKLFPSPCRKVVNVICARQARRTDTLRNFCSIYNFDDSCYRKETAMMLSGMAVFRIERLICSCLLVKVPGRNQLPSHHDFSLFNFCQRKLK